MARLVLRNGDEEKIIDLVEAITVIGRDPECMIILDVQECSRRQAHVERCEAGFKLVDLESRNGTRVNGKVSNQHLLQTGDIVKIGKVTLKYEGDPPAVAAAPSAAGPRPATRNHAHSPALSPERRTRRSRSPVLESRTAAGAAGISMAVLAGLIAVVLLQSASGPMDSARDLIEEASRLEARDLDGAMRKLKSVPPQAGRWYDEAQAKLRELERRRGLGRGALTEEEAWDILRDYATRHPGAEHAEEVVRQSLEFKAAHARSGHLPEVDEFIAAARQKKDSARLADIRKTEDEVAALLRRSRFGAAVQAMNALYGRHRSDLALRDRLGRRYAEIVEAGRSWFDTQYGQAKRLQAGQPDEAQRVCLEIVANLGDGKVEEFATACSLALLLHRFTGP